MRKALLSIIAFLSLFLFLGCDSISENNETCEVCDGYTESDFFSAQRFLTNSIKDSIDTFASENSIFVDNTMMQTTIKSNTIVSFSPSVNFLNPETDFIYFGVFNIVEVNGDTVAKSICATISVEDTYIGDDIEKVESQVLINVRIGNWDIWIADMSELGSPGCFRLVVHNTSNDVWYVSEICEIES